MPVRSREIALVTWMCRLFTLMTRTLATSKRRGYSHVGETTMRLGSVTSQIESGSNRLGIGFAPRVPIIAFSTSA
jgi:hypothetical protein